MTSILLVAELDIYILELIAGRDIVLLHRFEGSEKVLYGLLDGLAFPDALFISDHRY